MQAAVVLLAAAAAPKYSACAAGRWGHDCGGLCRCRQHEDCMDGPHGDGECVCRLGSEAACGIPERLVAAPVSGSSPASLAGLVMDSAALSLLWVDPSAENRPRQVFNASASKVLPTPLRTPALTLAAVDDAVAAALGIDPSSLALPDAAEYLSGRRLLAGSVPHAHCYGGHQFGRWSGQLGDGRAVCLGNAGAWEICLKGAGRTPYSRRGDGRAVLGNVLREALASGFLRAVGVPVTGQLAVVAASAEHDPVWRDEWYDGSPRARPAGVLVRVGHSFLRVGSAEVAAPRLGVAGVAAVARSALRAIAAAEEVGDSSASWGGAVPQWVREDCLLGARQTPSCAAGWSTLDTQGVLRCLLERVVLRTAATVAAWQAVGFAHGVMNTDNLSLMGITIDLNVWGVLERLDPSFTPNHIDTESRYAFGRQPAMALWGMERLADALAGRQVLPGSEWRYRVPGGEWMSGVDATVTLQQFKPTLTKCFYARQRLRMGLPAASEASADGVGAAEEEELTLLRLSLGLSKTPADTLVDQWLLWVREAGADYHAAAAALGELAPESAGDVDAAAEALASRLGAAVPPRAFLRRLRAAIGVPMNEWRRAVAARVPVRVPRTAAVRRLTDAAEGGDWGGYNAAVALLRQPFAADVCHSGAAAEVAEELSRPPAGRDSGATTSCGGQ